MSETRPGAVPAGTVPAADDPVDSPALIAEATKRAGLIWITVPGAAPRAAWHVWHEAAAYVLTGPGEQDVPGLAAARTVTVTVASKDTGGQLACWTAGVDRVEPGSAAWSGIIGALLAGRLNPAEEPGGAPPAQRWARTARVYRLAPSQRTATES